MGAVTVRFCVAAALFGETVGCFFDVWCGGEQQDQMTALTQPGSKLSTMLPLLQFITGVISAEVPGARHLGDAIQEALAALQSGKPVFGSVIAAERDLRNVTAQLANGGQNSLGSTLSRIVPRLVDALNVSHQIESTRHASGSQAFVSHDRAVVGLHTSSLSRRFRGCC